MVKLPIRGHLKDHAELQRQTELRSERRRRAGTCAEGIGAGFLLPFLGLLSAGDPYFSACGFCPQVILPLLIAAYLGALPGYLALAGEIAACLVLPFSASLLGVHAVFSSPEALLSAARIQLALCLLATGLAGAIRDSEWRSRRRLIGRFRGLYARASRMENVNSALGTLTDELQRRVSGQRDSISILYARMKRMDSLDISRVLDGLLETVRSFSQAESAAVYEYSRQDKSLELIRSIGTEAPRKLALRGSIEGWVFRNDSFFSLRMLDDLPAGLHGLEAADRPILAYQLKSGDLPWGVLTIRDMPFQSYNLTTENNIGVIVALSATSIRKATDFRDRLLNHPRDAITGLAGYADFMVMLGEEIEKRSVKRLPLSILIVELLDFEKIIFAYSGRKAFSLLGEIADMAEEESGGHALIFHYKSDSQLAFILPDMDRDGLSYFCISFLQRILLRSWELDGEELHIEPAFGLATLPESQSAVSAGKLPAASRKDASTAGGAAVLSAGMPPAAELLISEAERVLSVSKSAFRGHTEAENGRART